LEFKKEMIEVTNILEGKSAPEVAEILRAKSAALKAEFDANTVEKDGKRVFNMSIAQLEAVRLANEELDAIGSHYAKLNEAEKAEARFYDELRRLEAEAISKGEFIVRVTADKVPPKGTPLFQYPYGKFYLTQGYGYTSYARRGAYNGAPHNGIDIVSGFGSPIRPIADGHILVSGTNGGYGNWVAVRHSGGLVSTYAHMRAPSGIANGTAVSTDDIIGYEGSTGNSTGSHLHLGVYRDFFTYISSKTGELYFNYFEGSINPLDYLKK